LSFSVWANSVSGLERGVVHLGATGLSAGSWGFTVLDTSMRFGAWVNGAPSLVWVYATATADITNGFWKHISVTRKQSNGEIKLYINGTLEDTVTGPTGTMSAIQATKDMIIASYANKNSWIGNFDEPRVSNAIRSADWIKTQYNNQSATSTFYGIGGENNVPIPRSATTPAVKVYGTGSDNPGVKVRGGVIFR